MNTDRVLSQLVRHGIVTDVDTDKRMTRVKFQGEGITSGWLYVLQRYGEELYIDPDAAHTHTINDTFTGGGNASTFPAHDHLPGSYVTWWMPKIDDKVLVLYLPILNSDGFVLGRFG